MPVMVYDRDIAAELLAQRSPDGLGRYDEVWNGVTYIMTQPGREHQFIVGELYTVCRSVTNRASGDEVLPGTNVSDRGEGWKQEFRSPDVAVYLATNPAPRFEAHYEGGPDFAVEILSDNDPTYEKLPFYASVGTRELLVIGRDPWQLELFQLQAGTLTLVGTSTVAAPALLTSVTLPLTFRLIPGTTRPNIEVTDTRNGTVWPV